MTYSTTFKASKAVTKITGAMDKQIWYSPATPVIYLKRDDFEILMAAAPDYIKKNNPEHLLYKGYRVEVATR